MVMNIANAMSAYKKADVESLMPSAQQAQQTSAGENFSDVLGGFLGDAVDTVKKSEQMAAQSAVGKADLQDVILAVNDAEIMLNTITTIRDKVVSAYQEVIRTSI